MQTLVEQQLAASIAVKQALLRDTATLKVIADVAQRCADAIKHGRRLLLAGNGGSAADAQHIAAELVGRFTMERPGLPALALTTDTSLLTSVANDYGFDAVFRRQIEALGTSGDVFFAISTSGNSANIINAVAACAERGVISVALTGAGGGALAALCDYSIQVPSTVTATVQEAHITIGHAICAVIEQRLFGA